MLVENFSTYQIRMLVEKPVTRNFHISLLNMKQNSSGESYLENKHVVGEWKIEKNHLIVPTPVFDLQI